MNYKQLLSLGLCMTLAASALGNEQHLSDRIIQQHAGRKGGNTVKPVAPVVKTPVAPAPVSPVAPVVTASVVPAAEAPLSIAPAVKPVAPGVAITAGKTTEQLTNEAIKLAADKVGTAAVKPPVEVQASKWALLKEKAGKLTSGAYTSASEYLKGFTLENFKKGLTVTNVVDKSFQLAGIAGLIHGSYALWTNRANVWKAIKNNPKKSLGLALTAAGTLGAAYYFRNMVPASVSKEATLENGLRASGVVYSGYGVNYGVKNSNWYNNKEVSRTQDGTVGHENALTGTMTFSLADGTKEIRALCEYCGKHFTPGKNGKATHSHKRFCKPAVLPKK